MSAYCDSGFYLDDYQGSVIPGAEVDTYLLHASRKIDQATSYRIGTFDEWPDFTQRQVKLAVCAQAEHDYQYGEIEGVTAALGGYSIGDVSVSMRSGGSGNALSSHYKLNEIALAFLMPTGLLDRRLR